ncbi:hypothetical protein JOM56_013360 [Amanita muscaria]
MYLSATVTLGLSINHVLASGCTPFSNDLQKSFSLTPSCTASSSDLQSLVSCHVSLVIKRELDSVTYTSIQPTPPQRQAWSETIHALLDVDGNCSTISQNLHELLKSSYAVLEVGEFCVLVETSTVYNSAKNKNEYEKGWGIFVVPARKDHTKKSLHISAPHPIDDAFTGGQAGHVFENTGAKSLYIAGRARTAFRKQTNCIASTPSTTYWKADPAHDNEEMMFDTYKVILDWQNAEGGCSAESCAYIQLHGKGGKTCVADQAFMSSGLGREPDGVGWYNDPFHATLPVQRLSKHFTSYFPTWNATLPSSPHSNCPLTATKNIVGRLINGVSENEVCSQAATANTTKGAFVHIEQAIELRMTEYWDTWVKVVLDSFDDIPYESS